MLILSREEMNQLTRAMSFAWGTSPVNLNLQGMFFFLSNFHHLLCSHLPSLPFSQTHGLKRVFFVFFFFFPGFRCFSTFLNFFLDGVFKTKRDWRFSVPNPLVLCPFKDSFHHRVYFECAQNMGQWCEHGFEP